MSPIWHEEHIGYSRYVALVEDAERFIGALIVTGIENWGDSALALLTEADALLADDGPRGCGAAMAQRYREETGHETAAQLRERAAAALYGRAEASAITGGHAEPVEA